MSSPDSGQQYQGQWDQSQAQQTAFPAEPRNGLGTAALVLGILALLSLVICWVPFLGIVCVVLGLLALILGIVGVRRANRREATNKGAAIAGIVLGVLALLVGAAVQAIVISLTVLALNSGVGASFQQLQECVSQAQQQPSPAAIQQAVEQCQAQFGQQMPDFSGNGQ